VIVIIQHIAATSAAIVQVKIVYRSLPESEQGSAARVGHWYAVASYESALVVLVADEANI